MYLSMQVQCADSLPDGGVRVLTAFCKMSFTGEETGAETGERPITPQEAFQLIQDEVSKNEQLQEALQKVKDGVSEHFELIHMKKKHGDRVKQVEDMIEQCKNHEELLKQERNLRKRQQMALATLLKRI
jgi:hypothetical protein